MRARLARARGHTHGRTHGHTHGHTNTKEKTTQENKTERRVRPPFFALCFPLSIPGFCPRSLPLVSFEKATILLTTPEGKPDVAVPKDFDWNKVISDVEHCLPAADPAMMASWREFVDKRPKSHDDSKMCLSLPKWNFPLRPDASGPVTSSEIARLAVQERAVHVRHPASIVSSAGDGAEGRADRRARAAADEGLSERLCVLEPDTWAMVVVEYDDDGGDGCRIPRILVQLPSDFGGTDTTRPDAQISVRWWEPKPPDGKYDKEWRVWKQRGRQIVSEVKRSTISLVNVKFTRAEPLAGGFRKLNMDTKRRLSSDPGAKYGEFSLSPVS